jgi:phosphate starvation-inducible PhoH-like protein
VDLPPHKKTGLYEAIRILKKNPGVAVMEFQKKDVVRHALVQRIIEAYEKAVHSDPEETVKQHIHQPHRRRQFQ